MHYNTSSMTFQCDNIFILFDSSSKSKDMSKSLESRSNQPYYISCTQASA